MRNNDTTITDIEAELRAERESVLNNAIGAVWLAYIGGAITIKDADRLHQAIERAADRHRPLPGWAHLTSDIRH